MIRRYLSEFRIYICNNLTNKFPSHRFRKLFYSYAMNFEIGNQSTIHMNCTFDCAGGLSIGTQSVINAKCRIDTRGQIKIGNKTVVSQEVIILTADHDMDTPGFVGREKPVIIDDYVWIGTRAMILPGITIGRGAVVGAGSIVTKDVAAYTVVAGVPAKFMRMRSTELDYNPYYKRLFQ
jgi:acetyltransferase-like isoleucine patch superfamily enzyme